MSLEETIRRAIAGLLLDGGLTARIAERTQVTTLPVMELRKKVYEECIKLSRDIWSLE